jgi:hypothetical protein
MTGCPARDTSPACADCWDARGELKQEERHALSGSAWSFVRFMFCVFLILGLEPLRGQEWGEDCLGYPVRRGMQNVKNQWSFQNDLAWGIFAIHKKSNFIFQNGLWCISVKTEIVESLHISGAEIWFHDRFNDWKKFHSHCLRPRKISPNPWHRQ